MNEKKIWQKSRMELLQDLSCGDGGLTAEEAAERLRKYGPNELRRASKRAFFGFSWSSLRISW